MTNEMQRVIDRCEIEKLMARHAYYHGASQHVEELENIWVQEAEPSWTNNFGKWVGYELLMNWYGYELDRNLREAYEERVKVAPGAAGRNPRNVGTLMLHQITTPCIEIAGDGQTAKGTWYTPGYILDRIATDERPCCIWMWERYAVDFLRENGLWKIWHFTVYTDFCADLDTQSWVQDSSLGDPPPISDEDREAFEEQPFGATVSKKFYSNYSPIQSPQIDPRIPEPYKTFGETFSY